MTGQQRRIIPPLLVVGIFALAYLAWYFLSPRLAIGAFTDNNPAEYDFAALYDRASLRSGFEAQMLPQVDEYDPPFTKDVVLNALTDPQSVRLLVTEPFGEWQFAAAAGLPPDPEGDSGEEGPYMPRALETTEDWLIERHGFNSFTARGADRPNSNSYRFRRDGLGWTLEHIELTVDIR